MSNGRHSATPPSAALVVVVISLLGWTLWNLARDLDHPFADLSDGNYTDHFSHMNTARIFTHVGWDIWRKPLRSLGEPLTSDQRAALPVDIRVSAAITPEGEVFAVDGWPADKPFISSWTQNPRFHPPGNMILTSPVALAYSYTDMSFATANRLLIQLFLVYSHISLYLFFRAGLLVSRLKPLGFLVLFIVYGEVIHWTLEGFYEAAVLVPLLLCARWLYEKKALLAIFAFCVAANIHFRAYFFAPWVLAAAFILVRERGWKQWRAQEYALASGAAVLAFVSLGVFGLLFDSFGDIEVINKVSLAAEPVNTSAVVILLVVSLVIGAIFIYARAWLDLSVLAWFLVIVLSLREVQAWDTLSLLAWLAAPIHVREERWPLVRDARIAALAFLAVYVFNDYTFLAPSWLDQLFHLG